MTNSFKSIYCVPTCVSGAALVCYIPDSLMHNRYDNSESISFLDPVVNYGEKKVRDSSHNSSPFLQISFILHATGKTGHKHFGKKHFRKTST